MKKTIKIEGMTCGHCAGRVKKELEAICGVKSVDVSAQQDQAIVELNHGVADEKFEAAVKEAGYKVIGVN